MYKNIFEYHFEFNNKLLDEIAKEIKSLPERTFPLFCHLLNAHQIWNARILNQNPFGVQQQHEIEICKSINLENYENTLKIIEKFSLEESINYKNSKGKEFTNTINDILFHVANHSTHHKGQIINDFRNSGIEPIITDYIFYIRTSNNK